ncbi:protein lin-37 homolog isoform X2 [Varroa jacobsoni]|uniref:protein lin-37 homolog isoform X2 n=1 Tax=Varroa jacobsoni TaxID=62625 RepID=UPI000BF71EF1|nr:protein lin-37 homolog isoform X2 [Varroa jacobsoni]
MSASEKSIIWTPVAERTEDQVSAEQADTGDGKQFEKVGGGGSGQKNHGNQQHKSSTKPVKKKLEATANTVITKILDCSVDMANFGGRSPLYPMVRAWCRNDAHRDDVSSSGSGSEDEMLNDGRIVTVMPPPAPRAPDVPRVPPPLPPHGVQEIPIGSVGDDLPDAETMLAEHRERWRLVREQWAEASALNEERYFESCEILSKCQSIEEPGEGAQEWDGIEPLP